MNKLKWKILGIYEDLSYYILGLPRFLFVWKDNKKLSLLNFFDNNVKKRPNDIAFIFEGDEITWKEADEQTNKYAGFLKSQNINKGDCFAILMDNSPDFLMLLLASFRVGSLAALINTTVSGEGLKHVIGISNVKLITAGASHLEKLSSALGDSDLKNIPIFGMEDNEKIPDQVEDIKKLSKQFSTFIPYQPIMKDVAAYIFTSGTTGLPKAALVDHAKLVKGSFAGHFLCFNFNKNDRLYMTLPLYHSTGLILGWAASLRSGCPNVIKSKFSASDFWNDVKKYNVNKFIYVGELCRYLMNLPPSDGDKDNPIIQISGNGLRPDIWESFQKRFNINKIVEIYGATEAVGMTINSFGRSGMIGRKRSDSTIIHCNKDDGSPILSDKGFCTKVSEGETGLYIQKISSSAKFQGYLDAQASNKKILQNVFKTGDQYFNTGDLITLHDNNWLSFADRVGDTYRWKSENVSTMEVAAILNNASGVMDCNVYGVQVDSAEGKAGMAAMNVSDEFSFISFIEHVNKNLNTFQKPYFLRLTKEMQTTGTFKHQKEDLKKQGFNPSLIKDKLYFLQKDNYVEIDQSLYNRIHSGDERF